MPNHEFCLKSLNGKHLAYFTILINLEQKIHQSYHLLEKKLLNNCKVTNVVIFHITSTFKTDLNQMNISLFLSKSVLNVNKLKYISYYLGI